MNLRKATMDDARLLFDWRNDPQTRAASHQTGELDYSDHCAWLDRSLKMPGRKIWVAVTTSPVGTVRADTVDGVTELSWTIAPSMRGMGYGTQMVLAAVLLCEKPLKAEIKSTNAASVKIAERCGFVFSEEKDGVMVFRSS